MTEVLFNNCHLLPATAKSFLTRHGSLSIRRTAKSWTSVLVSSQRPSKPLT